MSIEQTKRVPGLPERLAALAARLDARQPIILDQWRASVEADPILTTSFALTRSQFYDHIPVFLEHFSDTLRNYVGPQAPAPERTPDRDALEHGLDRWHQGYRLTEVMGEWRHLHLCLVEELELASEEFSHSDEALRVARKELAILCNEGVCASAMQYANLQKTDAEGRLRDLERALEQFSQLEAARAELWREAAHDLRGSLGVVKTATAVLNSSDLPDQSRTNSLRMLDRSVESVVGMLNGLLDLARLEAGREPRELRWIDIAAELTGLCESVLAVANERGLHLEYGGPCPLMVEGDPLKILRIAQNLLLNAIHHTREGRVRLSWHQISIDDISQWGLVVQDTGPGFESGAAKPVAAALQVATAQARELHGEELDRILGSGILQQPDTPPRPRNRQTADRSEGGEGIGLSIVKRLCELLDATLELESVPGVGSTFKVIFPLNYNALASPSNPMP